MSAPEPGDWVRAVGTVPVTWTDHLAGGGIPAGTRGVVVGRSGRWIDVEFGTGMGTTPARVPAARLRLDRRGGGQEAFRERSRRVGAARLALAAFLLFPVVQFVAAYVWLNHSLDGIVPAFAVGAVESVGHLLATAIDSPVQSLVYAGFLAVLGHLAFPHRRR